MRNRALLQLRSATRFVLWVGLFAQPLGCVKLNAQEGTVGVGTLQVDRSLPMPPPSVDAGDPSASLGARDLAQEFKLPPVQNRPGDPVEKETQELQVMRRASALGLNERSATEAWIKEDSAYRKDHSSPVPPAELSFAKSFDGTLASDLNRILQQNDTTSIQVRSPKLILDTPIRIGRSGVRLDLRAAEIVQPTSIAPYMITIEKVHDVEILGGTFTQGPWAVLIADSENVLVHGLTVQGLEGGGILITASQNIKILHNNFYGLSRASVMLQGETTGVLVESNQMLADRGGSNWSAGVVLTDRNADVVSDPESIFSKDRYWVPEQPMALRIHIPHENMIVDNYIAHNASSGIYSDGGNRNMIVGNRIESNSKEGLCLDNGSIANVVAFNLFRANGRRWGKSDADLKLDFVDQFGRMSDGSSPAKVPAISIDNAIYNQIAFNTVDENYGGGIKLVRTAYYNYIGLNTLTDDNRGESPGFHFFGIEAGAAQGDDPSLELDFTPSRANQIFANTIRGPHYAGIFFAQGSDDNEVFDNTIFGATHWAIESVQPQPNRFLNNLTNLKSRNATPGLDPDLLPLWQGN